ncbi:N-acetylglucosamine-6-phosphate deacetylase [Nigerium massiliense]|uniref:N-acetylglucosamine-6-phosphate deacetylase n=1 Tax=Nigerium massiliense TaxID=1522317 RepID=UPI00058E6054|nr:N-acetylglucosamine-6-phosphate deacetylase [Nigerium massiliense]
MLIAATRLYVDDRFVPGWVRVEDDRIVEIGVDAPPPGLPHVNVTAGWVVPGFVDVHCHGGGGAAFGTSDPGDVDRALSVHRSHGSTTVVASLVTATAQVLTEQMELLRPRVEAGDLAGIHLEGPWLSPGHKGAHDAALLTAPHPAEVNDLVDAAGGTVRMVTIAPELPDAMDAIDELAGRGIVAAIGHTDATLPVAREALAAGARGGTHLFNAMPPLRHRDPGPILALWDSSAFLELIADGIHVHRELAAYVLRSFPDRVVLITDAMAAAGAPDGEYVLGELPVTVSDGVAKLTGTDTIAGSTLTLDVAVRTMVAAGVPLELAVRAATLNPARYLRLPDVGRLTVGAFADVLVLDEDLQVERVLRHGRWEPVR